MKLNLGNGDTPKNGYVNFDAKLFVRPTARTDVIGRMENMPFKPESFDEIFSAHVIEHFQFDDSIKLLIACFDLLKGGGLCIMEAPCVIGGYDYYVNKMKDIDRYIRMLYGLGPGATKAYGKLAQHKSGWTGPILAKEMDKLGFEITRVTHGRSHGMGKRDLRVEGRKA